MFRDVLPKMRGALGEDDPRTLSAVSNYESFLAKRSGRGAEAVPECAQS
jgi:hypothetical protein